MVRHEKDGDENDIGLFGSPKCNHNKLPLWGTDTFDLYFFMIHVCIYCCAVAHTDNTVPHVMNLT